MRDFWQCGQEEVWSVFDNKFSFSTGDGISPSRRVLKVSVSVLLALGSLLELKESNTSSISLGSVPLEVCSRGSSGTYISSDSEQSPGSRLKCKKLLVYT